MRSQQSDAKLPCTGSVCIATAFGLQRSSAICHIVSRCVAVFRCFLFDDDDDDDDDDDGDVDVVDDDGTVSFSYSS